MITQLIFIINLLLLITTHSFEDFEEELNIIAVEYDFVKFSWTIPEEIRNITTSYLVRATTIKQAQSRNTTKVVLEPTNQNFTFTNLIGNSTYRISVEAFNNNESILYISKLVQTTLALLKWLPAPTDLQINERGHEFLDFQWTAPSVAIPSYESLINQHEIIIYEYNPIKSTSYKLRTLTVRLPSCRVLIDRLRPGGQDLLYNITIRAGSSFGHGFVAWSLFSTLATGHEDILKLKSRTPNSLIIGWDKSYMLNKQKMFTIKAVTIYSLYGSNKELLISSHFDGNKQPEVVLKDLLPGVTFNICLITTMESQTVNNFHKTKNQVVKFKNTVELKKTWSVFSTMDQNSYAVSEPRIVVESQTAVSLVFHPIESENVVEYQIRYYRIGISDSAITTPILTENDVLCPKFGCDWSCYLIYNLQKNPREYEFEIKARVDKIWNKYVVFKRRAWSSLERQCSITPPFFMVKNLESVDYTREIDIDVKEYKRQGTWRYILIVDMRGNEGVTAAIDMTKLHDKSKAINDETPYYIAASFTEDNFNKMNKFIIGDAKMHGGFFNYPLSDRDVDPFWTIMPISQTENEVMEPKLKSCGINERGIVECELSVHEIFTIVPFWLLLSGSIILSFIIISLLFCLWRCSRKGGREKVSRKQSENTYRRTPSITFSTSQNLYTQPKVHKKRSHKKRHQSYNNVEYVAIEGNELDSILNFNQMEEESPNILIKKYRLN